MTNTIETLEGYWDYCEQGEMWIEFYQWKIRAKCSMAAMAVGKWTADQEGDNKDLIEGWILECMAWGLFEVRGRE